MRQVQKARFERLQRTSDADSPALTIARARRYLERYPEHGPAWLILGTALTEVACYEDAEEALNESIRLCPPSKNRISYAAMGHLYEYRRDYTSAAVWYQKAIEADPDHANGYIFLGGILARQGRLDEAESVHRAAIRCEAGCRDEAYLNLGLVLRAQERLVEAAECFKQALELDPDYRPAKRALRDVRLTIRFLRGRS